MSDYLAAFAVQAFMGLVLSWFIGLLPAFVYRYAVYREPIAKEKVFARLAPAVLVIGFGFKIAMAQGGGRPNANFIPWVIIYYVGKWIMTRPSRRRDTPQPSRSVTIDPPPTRIEVQATKAVPSAVIQLDAPRKFGKFAALPDLAVTFRGWHFGQLVVLWILTLGTTIPAGIGMMALGRSFHDAALERLSMARSSASKNYLLAQHPKPQTYYFRMPECDLPCELSLSTGIPEVLINQDPLYFQRKYREENFDAYTFLRTDPTLRILSAPLADSVADAWLTQAKENLVASEANLRSARPWAILLNSAGWVTIAIGVLVILAGPSLSLFSLWHWSSARAIRTP